MTKLKINKSLKSQAALEFLTTYGWAFLVILIMIGTLAYFGILNPSKVLPSRCNFGAEFQCLDYAISESTNTFRLRLKSNIQDPIDITGITLFSESSTPFSCSTPPGNKFDINGLPVINITGVTQANITDLLWSSCNSQAAGFAHGTKGKVLIRIRYNSEFSGSNYAKDVNGEVYTTVT